MKELLARLRIIWAVAAKDIVDGFKNRSILSAMGTVAFLIAFYKFLPRLSSGEELPTLVVYDRGESRLVAELEDSLEYTFYEVPELYRVERAVGRETSPWLGIVLPADLDRALEDGESPTLEGYVARWSSEADVAETQAFFEERLSKLAGVPVRIDAQAHRVYPQPDWGGQGFLTSVTLVIVPVIVGCLVVTHLLIEEKQAKTLDALLVSPAGVREIVLGKAVAGAVYTVGTTAIVFATNASVIANWGLAVTAALCGVLFSVAVGLFLGSLFDSRQQLTLWGFLVMNVLLVPVFLSIMSDLLPETLLKVFQWLPTVALSWVFRISFSDSVPWWQVASSLGVVVLGAALLYAGVWLRVRRLQA